MIRPTLPTRSVIARVLLCLLVIAGSAFVFDNSSTAGGTTPILGLLGTSGNDFTSEQAAGVQAVTIQATWDNAEQSQNTFSSSYLNSLLNKIAAARSAGLSVVLDPGLQYAPNWVFSLPGGTQFVNQYQHAFTGGAASGNHVANGVTDLSVRSAEQAYLSWLGAGIPSGDIIAVRQGGGPLGELRYPLADYNSDHNSFWAYDASTQALLPSHLQGWTPGTGTTADAQTFLNAYNQNLVDYGVWMNGQLRADFGVRELLMLPGWGERPDSPSNAPQHDEVAALLDPAHAVNEYNEGLDWVDLLPALPDPSDTVAYTTYLDAHTVLPTPQLEDPADFLNSLAAGTSIRLGGENTGNGTVSILDYCAGQARALNFYLFEWMGESQLGSSAGGPNDPPSLAQLGAALATATPPPTTTTTTPSAGGGAAPVPVATSSVPSAAQHLSGSVVGIAAIPGGGGYWIAAANGGVAPFGNAAFHGSMAGRPLNSPINHIVATPDGQGYWLVAADGGTFTFGDAHFFGSMGGRHLNAPVVDLAPTADGRGYWLVASDGGIFAFGDAHFHGSMGGSRLNRPVVGITADAATGGYWLVASDGGIFAFGAPFFGSTGAVRLNLPINGMTATADGRGYWFVASDGGIFSFGDARFHGSTGAIHLADPIVGMAAAVGAGGYWLVGAGGAVFSFAAPFYGAA